MKSINFLDRLDSINGDQNKILKAEKLVIESVAKAMEDESKAKSNLIESEPRTFLGSSDWSEVPKNDEFAPWEERITEMQSMKPRDALN